LVLSYIVVRFKLNKEKQNKQISFAFSWITANGGTHKSCNAWNYTRWHKYVKIKLVKGYLTSSNLTNPFVITWINLGCPCDLMLAIVLQIHLVYFFWMWIFIYTFDWILRQNKWLCKWPNWPSNSIVDFTTKYYIYQYERL
jgi:hypothetical protein